MKKINRKVNFLMLIPLLSALLLVAGTVSVRPALAENGTYPMLESAFEIPNLTGNPFDYTENDVVVTLALPEGKSVAVPAFFDGGNTWRVRFTPVKSGKYRVKTVTRNGQPVTPEHLIPVEFTVSGK